jgi:hypothetical protein
MDIKRICNHYAIGRIRSEDLPSVAQSLILEGIESSSLTRLLIDESPYGYDKKTLFEKAMKELGFEIPSKNNAAIALVREIANQIINNEIDAYKGSMKIWKEILNYLDNIPDNLLIFKSNASSIEDMIFDTYEFRANHEEAILKLKNELFNASKAILNEA